MHDSAPGQSEPTHFWRDPGFWVALSLGPLCWLVLYGLGLPVRSTAPPLMAWTMIVLVYPVLEEIVFRGAIQGALLKRKALSQSLAGISLASIITSLLFAAAHLLQQTPLMASLVFLPSLVFGWARERHHSLLSPTLLHIAYNAGFITLFQTI